VVPADETCWTLIRDAAGGDAAARETFGRIYLPPVRAYLTARWRNTRFAADVDDAVQEVFLDFLKPAGALQRVDPAREGGFRAFLYGVTRIAAKRVEGRHSRPGVGPRGSEEDLEAVAADETGPSGAFDRAWAEEILRAAGRRQEEQAHKGGPEAEQRVELLRLRFHEGLPIRAIAERWGADAASVHHEYARARAEFEAALMSVVGEHHSGPPAEVRRECARLLSLLA
jgi:RNA polymerase sigma factor (sigma-70 family)